MDLFIRVTNPKYLEILVKGPFVPMKIVNESVLDGVVVPQGLTPKVPSEFTDAKKETVALDVSLQLIIVEYLDDSMYNHLVNFNISKHMWEMIKIICEGIEKLGRTI